MDIYIMVYKKHILLKIVIGWNLYRSGYLINSILSALKNSNFFCVLGMNKFFLFADLKLNSVISVEVVNISVM